MTVKRSDLKVGDFIKKSGARDGQGIRRIEAFTKGSLHEWLLVSHWRRDRKGVLHRLPWGASVSLEP